MEPSIEVEGLSKRYVVAASSLRSEYRTLRETLTEAVAAPVRRWMNCGVEGKAEEFWALRDVNFQVRPGEVVGIVGRNGAGKSTLLKILARITKPTEGKVVLRGRVGSLLEVGSGFHNELSGRENVFLNGSILGMSRSEIMRRFDEIVDFSGVERFLDTPVKRYSSGMRVRLAFAVAAHLEPEMLLVDEVLAVGDAQFQRKCLGKMSEVADSGRTVMFVSHNMAAVQRLCKRGILLQDSQVAADGDVETVVQQYLSQFEQQARVEPALRTDRGGRGDARLTRVEIENPSSDRHSIPRTGDPLRLSFYFDRRLPYMSCAFTLYDLRGGPIANFNSRWQGQGIVQSSDGEARIVCDVPELLVLPGRYRLNVSVSAADVAVDKLDAAAVFDVEEGDVRGQAVPRSTAYGSCYFPHAWTSDDEQRRSAPGAEAFPIEDVPACG